MAILPVPAQALHLWWPPPVRSSRRPSPPQSEQILSYRSTAGASTSPVIGSTSGLRGSQLPSPQPVWPEPSRWRKLQSRPQVSQLTASALLVTSPVIGSTGGGGVMTIDSPPFTANDRPKPAFSALRFSLTAA